MVATFERPLLAGLNCLWIIAFTALTVTFVCTGPIAVNGAPIIDSKETPFPLELQPPLVDDDFSSKPSAIDSYGNPINTLKPIETPDGRKVVSAQGLQFEIPTYASGITEIKKPADDLLPPFIDSILKAEPEAVPAQTAKPFGQGNPFLAPYNNGAYNPQPKPFSKNTGKYNPPIATTTTSTTTTTTTTTTTPAPLEKNPFDSATIPPWLSGFDYPDVGPGVPFSYDHDDPESAVFNDLLPPANQEAQATDSSKPVFVTTSPASFNNFNSPHNFPQHETQSSSTVPSSSSSAATTTTSLSSPSFPSKVTLPLPSINNNNNQHQLASRFEPTDTAAAQPPLVFIPPSTAAEATPSNDHSSVTSVNANPYAENAKNPSSSFNQNFPAPFEPETSAVPAQTPSSADQEAFPPFGGSSSVPSKTTFTKSDEGKVITNNVFLNPAVGAPQQTSKPFTFGNPQKDFQAPNNNQFFTPTATGSGFTSTYSTQNTGFTASSSTFNEPSTPASTQTTGAGSFSSAASGFTKTSSATTTYAGAGKYTGGFGGAPGVLVAANIGQTGGPIRDPNQIYRASTPSSATVPIAAAPTALPRPIAHQSGSFAFGNAGGSFSSGTTVAQKYESRFGGPPGILEPYDNVKNGRP